MALCTTVKLANTWDKSGNIFIIKLNKNTPHFRPLSETLPTWSTKDHKSSENL